MTGSVKIDPAIERWQQMVRETKCETSLHWTAQHHVPAFPLDA